MQRSGKTFFVGDVQNRFFVVDGKRCDEGNIRRQDWRLSLSIAVDLNN